MVFFHEVMRKTTCICGVGAEGYVTYCKCEMGVDGLLKMCGLGTRLLCVAGRWFFIRWFTFV